MPTSAYEVPTEMREFAERSVAQARKAFEGFMGAVQKSATAIEPPAGNPALTGAKDMSAKAVAFAESLGKTTTNAEDFPAHHAGCSQNCDLQRHARLHLRATHIGVRRVVVTFVRFAGRISPLAGWRVSAAPPECRVQLPQISPRA
jgi:hypothetical protein